MAVEFTVTNNIKNKDIRSKSSWDFWL